MNESKSVQNKSAPITPRWKWILWAVVLAGLATVALYVEIPTRIHRMLEGTLDWIRQLGVWGPVAFIILYIFSCVALIPGSVLTLGAGAVFGFVKGAVYVSIGATLGAAAAFLTGRYLARDWVARKIAGHPKFEAIDRAVAKEGGKIVLLTRLCPIFPFFLLNYAFGLTRVSFRHYVLATWIGIMPASTLFVYIGSLANPSEAKASPVAWAVRITGLIATIAITIYLTKTARRALAQRIGD